MILERLQNTPFLFELSTLFKGYPRNGIYAYLIIPGSPEGTEDVFPSCHFLPLPFRVTYTDRSAF